MGWLYRKPDAIKDVHDEVLRMSGKLEAINTRDADHEARIRVLEKFRYAFPISALASISAVVLTVWQGRGH